MMTRKLVILKITAVVRAVAVRIVWSDTHRRNHGSTETASIK